MGGPLQPLVRGPFEGTTHVRVPTLKAITLVRNNVCQLSAPAAARSVNITIQLQEQIRFRFSSAMPPNAWLQRRGANPGKLRRRKYHRKDAIAASAASRCWASS